MVCAVDNKISQGTSCLNKETASYRAYSLDSRPFSEKRVYSIHCLRAGEFNSKFVSETLCFVLWISVEREKSPSQH